MEALRDRAAEHGVAFISTRLTDGNKKTEGLYMDFTHPTAAGNEAFATDIVRFLLEAGLVR